MNKTIELLQRQHLVWHATDTGPIIYTSPSGYAELDSKLQGGFPEVGIIEVSSPLAIGELRLLLPHIKQRAQDRLSVFIDPPGHISAEHLHNADFNLQQVLIIYPKTPKEALWAAEQCLKSGACSSVLHWYQTLEIHHVRRFHTAAEIGNSLHFLLRNSSEVHFSLPVHLSMKLTPHPLGIEIEVPKRKGGWPLPAFSVDMSSTWPSLTLTKPADNIITFPTPVAM